MKTSHNSKDLEKEIIENAIAYKAVFVDVQTIERINILEAVRMAFAVYISPPLNTLR